MIHDFINIVYRVASGTSSRLFVYGTLMRGEEAHHKLNGAQFLGKVNTAPRYRLNRIDNDFYEMTSGNESVPGELYEVTSDLLQSIDEWEYSIYYRKEIELEDGSFAYAYMT